MVVVLVNLRIPLTARPKISMFYVLLFLGDCGLDSRRLLCRDVRLHARSENAPASGTAAGHYRRFCFVNPM